MTEESSEVPKELQESIRDVIGRKIKIAVRKKVKLEIKGDKVENKVLVLTSCRAFILTARVPTKLELTFSYLEIQGILCSKPGHLVVETEKGNISLKMFSSDDVNEVVAHIGTCLRKIFPGLSPVKIMRKVTMEPSDRLTNLQALWDSQTVTEVGPCGGFSQMYACVCDWLSMPYREEVQWDVDTIYLTQDTRELNLQDFSHLDHRDLIPIVAALEYNLWFTKLSSKDLKLSTDVCDQILRVVSRSSRLEELVLENAGLRTDFAQKLSSALSYNPSSGLHTINLANNPLEDRGVSFLSTQFAKLPRGLIHLNLSKTSISPKGVNSLSQSLSAMPLIATTLTHLDLSGNILRGDELSYLYTFLAQPNAIKYLDLSNTECSADAVCGALLRGCLQHLTTLNLSRTFFPHRKGKEVPPTFKQFFSSSLALSHINFSGTKLSPEPLKALLLGLACNLNLKEVSLDLSNCELRSGGAQVLEGCIAEIHNITSLDISDNGLESDLSTLVVWLSKNRSIRHLALGKNFNNMKSKNLTPVLDNLVHMIQDEESPLQSLSLADSKLKTDVTIIINALGSNTSLTKVDISGNAMGDMGAKMLAKALQINTKLRTVIWDKNNITAQGFQDISVALEKNYTLRFMPIPINDASQALKTNPEKTEEALQKIENYLLRNHETRKYLQEQAYRLQQSIVTSTTQHMIDRICVKVQDHLNSLRNCGIDFVIEDVKSAEKIMRDAKNSKTLLPNLYHLGGAAWAGANNLPTPIQETLESMAGEVTRVVDDQLKVFEVKLTVASFLSDRIVDEILDALSSSHHKLADHLTKRGKPLPHQESMEIETVEERPTKRSVPTIEELSEMERLEDLDTCMMTPKSKRKSIHSRMLRPVSRAFEMEFDLDKALEDVPIHIEDPPYPSYKQDKRSSSVIAELPSEEGKKLEHFTKLRPKRMKKQQPSKSNQSGAEAASDGDQNGLIPRVDEGVDEFFSKKVTRLDSKKYSLKGGESQDIYEGEEKKKRESRKSGFLNLIKSRSKSERPQTVIVTEEPPSPKPSIKSPAPDTSKKDKFTDGNGAVSSSASAGSSGPSSSTERSEELKTPDSLEENMQLDDLGKTDSKSSPQSGRRYGVQVMGSGLLAEMKAKQERRAANKKLGSDVGSKDLLDVEKADGSGAVPKFSRGDSTNSCPEKNVKGEVKSEGSVRSKSSSSTPTSPKPPLQSTKPVLTARPSVPQKPRSGSRTEDIPDSPSGPCSPKTTILPSVMKRAPSEKDRDGPSSPQPSSRPHADEAVRPTTPSDSSPKKNHSQSPDGQELKSRSSSKDSHQRSKSSDSGEEADKEFVFI
ncbi:F-actin-uncapping protein LRRC16A [Anomaloglossus baeobatrachus]|uniref:F-actin-uncapping protein LRRC16A n=1 Tax=Anomaloglossus baeobatrachus TaxID=238106 RepID=UPI003F4F8D17